MLSVGWMGDAWEPSDKAVCFHVSVEQWTKKYFHVVVSVLRRLVCELDWVHLKMKLMESWKFSFMPYDTLSKYMCYAKNSLIMSSRDTFFGYWDSVQFSSSLRTSYILVVRCVTIFEKLFLQCTPHNNFIWCVCVCGSHSFLMHCWFYLVICIFIWPLL
jgi:hypothetical protein